MLQQKRKEGKLGFGIVVILKGGVEMKKYLVLAMVAAMAVGACAQPMLQEGVREIGLEGYWDSKGPTGKEIAVGVTYGVYWRDEIELGAILDYGSTADGDNKEWKIFLFAEKDFDMGGMTVPYICAKLGWGKTKDTAADLDVSAFLYGPRVGIKQYLSDNVALDVGIEYMFSAKDFFNNAATYEKNDLIISYGVKAFF